MSKILLQIISGNKVQTPILEDGVTWKTERRGAPGQLEFTVVKDETLGFHEGDSVRLYVDDTPVFFGFVFTKSRDKEHRIKVTAYDQLRYLKNKDTLTYKEWDCAKLINTLADSYGLSEERDLASTEYICPQMVEDNSTLFDMILNHLDKVTEATSKMYVLYDNFGTLVLKDIEKMYVPYWIREENIENFDYQTSIDGETYNIVKIILSDSEGSVRHVYTAKSTQNINKWGILQLTEELDSDKYSSEDAKVLCADILDLYNRVERKLSLKGVIGDLRVRAGTWIPVTMNLGDIVLGDVNENTAKPMIVESVTHTWEGGSHKMDLTLVSGGGWVA